MLVKKFLETLKAKNRSAATITGAESFLGINLEDATYDDLLKYLGHLRTNGLNTNSLSLRGSQIVQFLKFCLNYTDDEKYNRLIRKFKDVVAERQKNDINPTELLGFEDVKRLINVSKHTCIPSKVSLCRTCDYNPVISAVS